MRAFESVADYHDHLASVILSAPDNFYDVGFMGPAVDQPQALKLAFDRLRSEFQFVRRKVANEHLAEICQKLVDMAFEAYATGDKKTGAHTLGEFRGMVWPSHAVRPKYAVEAERRAFGVNSLFANVVVSPYPYEGTFADLGSDQAELLSLAERWCHAYLLDCREFKYFAWVVATDGIIKRTSVEPKEDGQAILKPLQRGWGLKRLKELARSGEIQACVLMSVVGPQGDGIVCYDLEQQGRPRVSARQLFTRRNGAVHHEGMRFHLEDPNIFPSSSSVA